MQRNDKPLQRTGIQILLFVLSLIVVSWPLVAQSTPWSLTQLIGYLFAIWAAGILLLFLLGRSGQHSSAEQADDEPSAGDPH